MAQTQTLTTKSPLLFSPENGIFEEDIQALIEQMNWTFGHITMPHLSIHVGEFSSGFETHAVAFPAVGAYADYYSGRTYVDPDVDVIEIEATATLAGVGTGRIRITVGGTNGVLNFTAGTSTQSSTLATSATGTGVLSWTVEIETLTGTSHTLDRLRIEDQAITSSFPDPVNE